MQRSPPKQPAECSELPISAHWGIRVNARTRTDSLQLRRHGRKFAYRDAATWPEPSDEHQTDDLQ